MSSENLFKGFQLSASQLQKNNGIRFEMIQKGNILATS